MKAKLVVRLVAIPCLAMTALGCSDSAVGPSAFTASSGTAIAGEGSISQIPVHEILAQLPEDFDPRRELSDFDTTDSN